MKNNKKLTLITAVIGVLLILLAAGIMVYDSISRSNAEDNVPKIVEEMYSLMPEVHAGVPEERADNTMSVIPLKNGDFAGLIEVPLWDIVLPVSVEWGNGMIDDFPCRFTGSVYDGSLIVGGSGDDGQFGFVREISIGANVAFTDTAGERYSYTVTDIETTDDVSYENLSAKDADLVLFARDPYGFDYTVVRCMIGK